MVRAGANRLPVCGGWTFVDLYGLILSGRRVVGAGDLDQADGVSAVQAAAIRAGAARVLHAAPRRGGVGVGVGPQHLGELPAAHGPFWAYLGPHPIQVRIVARSASWIETRGRPASVGHGSATYRTRQA